MRPNGRGVIFETIPEIATVNAGLGIADSVLTENGAAAVSESVLRDIRTLKGMAKGILKANEGLNSQILAGSDLPGDTSWEIGDPALAILAIGAVEAVAIAGDAAQRTFAQ